MKKLLMISLGAIGLSLLGLSSSAQAGVTVSVNLGSSGYGRCGRPAPVYYYPAPRYACPPPVIVYPQYSYEYYQPAPVVVYRSHSRGYHRRSQLPVYQTQPDYYYSRYR